MPGFLAIDNTTGRKKSYASNAVIALLNIDNEAFTALSYGTTTTWNTNSKFISKRTLALTGNTTLAITNSINGQVGTIIITASATSTVTLPTSSYKTNGFDLNFVNTTKKILSYIYDGTSYYWSGSEYV